MYDIEGKVVVLAGSGGISTATARLLGAGGAKVVASDISAEAAEIAAEAAGEGGAEARHIACDISLEADVEAVMKLALDEFGRIDGLFNVAADIRPENIGVDTNPIDIDLDIWRHTLDVNLTGYLLTIRHALPSMLEVGGGSIVNTMSASAYLGEPLRVAYGVSKAGIGALTRHVARLYGKRGVRCNAIAPGTVLTPALLGNLTQEERDIQMEPLPHTRFGEPEDIGAMVVHLISAQGSWINGQSISVDGGMVMRP